MKEKLANGDVLLWSKIWDIEATPSTKEGLTMTRLISSTQSQLVINENFMIHFTAPMPNRWHRPWYRLLLGWRWEAP